MRGEGDCLTLSSEPGAKRPPLESSSGSHGRMPRPIAKTLLVLAALCASCASSRHRFYFVPSPLELLVSDSSGSVIAHGLASVREGLRRDDDSLELHVRLNLENNTDASIRLLAERVRLFDSRIEKFGLARIEGSPLEIPARGDATYELYFPYPDGLRISAPDIDGLNLRFGVAHARGEIEVTGNFERALRPVDSNPDVQWTFGFISTN